LIVYILPISALVINLMIKRIKIEDRNLFEQLKSAGYSSWLFQPKDKMKIAFVPVFSVSFLIISWLLVTLVGFQSRNFKRRASFIGTKNCGGGKARAGREFIFPTPLFLPAPPERRFWFLPRFARQSKFAVRIFVKKSSDFNQKVPPRS